MTVLELKNLIAGLPDNAVIIWRSHITEHATYADLAEVTYAPSHSVPINGQSVIRPALIVSLATTLRGKLPKGRERN